MPINPYKPYPVFNPNNPYQVLDIPDNISRKFGIYSFTFKKGTKCNAVTKQYNGDYIIIVNNSAFKDLNIWNLVLNSIGRNLRNIILRLLVIVESLWSKTPQKEGEIFSTINNFQNNFPYTYQLIRQNNIHLDRVQTFLYYSWHRCHIEERVYPSYFRYNGRGDYLGATYILFANVYGLRPINNNLRNQIFQNPKYVFSWARSGNNKADKKLAFQDYLSLIQQNKHIQL